jgi:hypothetical protein
MCKILANMTQVSDVAPGPLIYCLMSSSRIFHLYGVFIITDEWLQNLGLCLALRAFEQEGIFILPHLL